MNDLKKQKIWLCWKYITVNGRRTKKPYSITGKPTAASPDHASEWVDYDTSWKAYRQKENGFDGVGFVLPEGYFLLDGDSMSWEDPIYQEIYSLLHTYGEVSPSGNGFHFIGKYDPSRIPKVWDKETNRWKLDPQFLMKNSPLGLEIYFAGLTNRFATFTGDVLPDGTDIITDCTDGILLILNKYMRRKDTPAMVGSLDTERFTKLSEDAIPVILEELRCQKNGAKFTALFDDGDITDYKSFSEADAALCAMIAFRTGPDPDIIDAAFRESALYRDKWERADYRAVTINAGIKACHGVFHKSVKVTPPFVLANKDKDYVHPTLLADYVRKKVQYLFVREAMRGSFQKYVYEDGCYRNYSDEMFKGVIKAFVTDYNPILLKMSTIDEAFRQLNTDLDHIPQSILNADESLINFQNGLLDIRTLELRPHDPSVYSSIQLPCRWVGRAIPTPIFNSYLNTLTGHDKDTKRLLLEFMGACLSNVPGYRMKKALFLYGPGDTGKSQLKRLVEKLLGEGNYTGIDLQQMEARFGTSAIYGKRLAGTSDMSFMTINELKVFKKTTGGDALFAEFKGQDSFEFVYAGLLWFCMNELPKFGGDDGSWVFERILPVHCPHVVPVEKRDSQLLEKMYAEREGIVQKAVKAFKGVIDRGYRFTETQGLISARADYRTENNTALEFFRSCMQRRKHPVRRDDPYTVKQIYFAYCDWYDACYGKKYRKSKKEFYRSIADSLGTTYEDMVVTNAKGTVLRDYCPNPDAWEEYKLETEVLGDVRRWAA